MNYFRKCFSVYENDGLRHATRVEDLHYELRFFLGLTLKGVLLDVGQAQALFFHPDLLGLAHYLVYRVLARVWVSCAEEQKLDWVGKSFDLLQHGVFNALEVFFIFEKDICFVNNDHLELRDVDAMATS